MTVVSEADWSWFEAHAEAIVKATPAVCAEVLMSYPDEEEAAPVSVRLASIPGIDHAELLLWAESSVSEETLAKLRAAVDARTHTGA